MIAVSANEEPMPQLSELGPYASLASQYGPFFLAILFVLFVPLLGQMYFAEFLRQRTEQGAERDAALQVYKFYWLQGVVAGLSLVAISVAWWLYVQYAHILPAQRDFSRAQFEALVQKRAREFVFEGIIRDASDDDMFLFDTNKPYRLYTYMPPNLVPPVVQFVAVFPAPPSPKQVIYFSYGSRAGYEAAKAEKKGYRPHPIKLCLDRPSSELWMVRDDKGQKPPHFDKDC
jgi:hypothetical protein